MKLSPRESMLALATGAVLLFGITGVWGTRQFETWEELRRRQGDLREKLAEDEDLVASNAYWTAEFEALRARLPQFPPDTKMDVHWLSVVEGVARRHEFRILKRQVGEPEKHGAVYELPIDCRDWEASLDSLVHFLFDLRSESAMLDVRQLLIRPDKNATNLRGRFLLHCAYTRGPGTEEK